MAWENIFSSDAGLTMVSAALGSIWTAFKTSEWRRRAQETRYAKAVQALEAGVDTTYRAYVQSIKEARTDGKLTAEEAALARERAIQTAVTYGREQGVDVLTEVGANYADLLIAKLVKKLKQL